MKISRLVLVMLTIVILFTLVAAGNKLNIRVVCASGDLERVSEKVIFTGNDCSIQYNGDGQIPPTYRPTPTPNVGAAPYPDPFNNPYP